MTLEDVPQLKPKDVAWQAVMDHLTEAGIKGIFVAPGSRRGDFNYTGRNGISTIVSVKIQSGCLVIKVLLPVAVPEDQRDEMSQLLTHVNFGLLVGGFQMDVAPRFVWIRTTPFAPRLP